MASKPKTKPASLKIPTPAKSGRKAPGAPARAIARFGRHEYRRDDVTNRFEGGMDQGRNGRGFHFTPEDEIHR